ncbi:hypothetical protein [Conexibacter sp. DBS9H8]|uniref:hypothetical protein n=1 Tax=Conexibacter sp. DBS9H8 TaxID=2937801 RepID=UPI0020102584|nr:hypothetical protein [Conexibacter sp. DBS9H8]
MSSLSSPHRIETENVKPSAVVQKWTVAVLTGLGVILTLIIVATVAIHGAQNPPLRPVVQVLRVSESVPVQPVVYLSVAPGVKPGPDGQLHDAFSQTTFAAYVGRPVRLVINNTDTVPHSIVSAAAGVDITVRPGTHTYTLLVKKSGIFQWHCSFPCDPYSMSHVGYMMGTIVAQAPPPRV